jgi:hypothetical protein
MAASAPVLWYAKRQTLSSRSTFEAELIASDIAARESIWLQALWCDISRTIPSPIPLLVDNESAEKLIQRPAINTRNRHFRARLDCVLEAQRDGLLTVSHVPSSEQAADGFTKPLDPTNHQRFLALIHLTNSL